jgi:hypothetical protein
MTWVPVDFDASRCKAYGPGLVEAVQNEETEFFVEVPKDASPGKLEIKVEGPKNDAKVDSDCRILPFLLNLFDLRPLLLCCRTANALTLRCRSTSRRIPMAGITSSTPRTSRENGRYAAVAHAAQGGWGGVGGRKKKRIKWK